MCLIHGKSDLLNIKHFTLISELNEENEENEELNEEKKHHVKTGE